MARPQPPPTPSIAADGCAALGIPVTGGNVSFYNQTGDTPIFPTPVVGVLGIIDDVARRIPSGWQDAGEKGLKLERAVIVKAWKAAEFGKGFHDCCLGLSIRRKLKWEANDSISR